MRFYTADTHYQHANIQKFCPTRPGKDINQHDQLLIKNHNDVVGKDDEVYFLGDFAFAPIEKIASILGKLNGRKHLIIGNHDQKRWVEYVDAGFESVQRFKMMLIKGFGAVGLAHDPSTCIVEPKVPWFCGHLHHQFLRFGNAINVGVDVRKYKPVSELELMEDLRITVHYHMEQDPYAKKEILGVEE